MYPQSMFTISRLLSSNSVGKVTRRLVGWLTSAALCQARHMFIKRRLKQKLIKLSLKITMNKDTQSDGF